MPAVETLDPRAAAAAAIGPTPEFDEIIARQQSVLMRLSDLNARLSAVDDRFFNYKGDKRPTEAASLSSFSCAPLRRLEEQISSIHDELSLAEEKLQRLERL